MNTSRTEIIYYYHALKCRVTDDELILSPNILPSSKSNFEFWKHMLIYNKRKCCICVSTICCRDENQMLHPPTSSSSSKVSRLLLSSQLFCIHVNYTLYSCILEAISTYVKYERKYEILRKFLNNEPVFSDWFFL